MDVRALVGQRPTGDRPLQIVSGYASYQKSAPGAFTDPLWVVIPSHSTEIAWEFTYWPAIHGATLPVQGTPVLVAWDEQRVMHIIGWDGVFTPYSPIYDPGG